MKNILIVFLSAILVTGCGSDGGSDKAEQPAAKGSSGDDPKWSVAIEGRPLQAGSTIVAVTMGGNGQYTLGRSGFRASLNFHSEEPVPSMMFNFEKEAIRCVNKKGASAVREGKRAVLSGEVMCYPKSSSFDEAQAASITGYFELKEQ